MSESTGISWSDRTASPWYGCQHVSPACDHCYAEAWAKRSGFVKWGPHEERRRAADYAKKLHKWDREAAAAGVAFHFKQWGEWRQPLCDEDFSTEMGAAQRIPAYIVSKDDGTVHCFHSPRIADGNVMLRVGKKAAGRELDGREWSEFPT